LTVDGKGRNKENKNKEKDMKGGRSEILYTMILQDYRLLRRK
jgi:hypothetical protein